MIFIKFLKSFLGKFMHTCQFFYVIGNKHSVYVSFQHIIFNVSFLDIH